MNEPTAIRVAAPICRCEKGGDFYVAVFPYHRRAFAIPPPHVCCIIAAVILNTD